MASCWDVEVDATGPGYSMSACEVDGRGNVGASGKVDGVDWMVMMIVHMYYVYAVCCGRKTRRVEVKCRVICRLEWTGDDARDNEERERRQDQGNQTGSSAVQCKSIDED